MKGLSSENYFIEAFLTHKTQTYGYTYLSGSNPAQVSVNLAINTPYDIANPFNISTEAVNSTGIYSRPLFSSLRQLFYTTNSVWNNTPNAGWNATGSQLYVISVAQQAYGEKIVENSFVITTGAGTGSIYDNGNGGLVSTNGIVVGRIFYGLGIAVIQQNISANSASVISNNGMYLTTGSNLSFRFNASHTIYQHMVMCTMDIGEFNYSVNPSMTATQSVYSATPIKVMDAFASGTLTPYMTSVGLYSDKGELVAVGKFPRPIKRATDSQQTVIIKFDI